MYLWFRKNMYVIYHQITFAKYSQIINMRHCLFHGNYQFDPSVNIMLLPCFETSSGRLMILLKDVLSHLDEIIGMVLQVFNLIFFELSPTHWRVGLASSRMVKMCQRSIGKLQLRLATRNTELTVCGIFESWSLPLQQ